MQIHQLIDPLLRVDAKEYLKTRPLPHPKDAVRAHKMMSDMRTQYIALALISDRWIV